MKKLFLLALAAVSALCISGCHKRLRPDSDNDKPTISGTITIDRQYGTPQPDFTAKDMLDRGFNYGDLVHVTIGKDISVVAPFVTAYTQAGIMGISCCDYGKKGGTIDMGIANGNFHERVGGEDGDPITITMEKEGGYLKEYNLLQGAYDNDRSHYATDAVFANFRMVTTTGMGEGKLYRGSNPLNADKNPVRFGYMDDFARQVGIKTEIDLADDDDMIKEQIAKRTDPYDYCRNLYAAGNVIGLKMGADTFSDEFKGKLRDGILFMIDHEPPYLIHCNEGKDRCGFVTLLLEGLMGASVDEIERDYMVTFENYYGYPAESETWELNKRLNVDRMLQLLLYPQLLKDITKVNWNQLMDGSTKLYDQVIAFLKSDAIQLKDEQIDALKAKLK